MIDHYFISRAYLLHLLLSIIINYNQCFQSVMGNFRGLTECQSIMWIRADDIQKGGEGLRFQITFLAGILLWYQLGLYGIFEFEQFYRK